MKTEILGVKFDNLSFAQVQKLCEKFAKSGKKHYIVTPYSESVVLAQKDTKLRQILNSADLSCCDGTSVFLTSKILGKQIKERVRGVDLADFLCQLAAKKSFKIGFLGALDNVAEKAAERQKKKYPNLPIAFVSNANPVDKNLVTKINQSNCDILLVAYGVPKQEKWIFENLAKLNVKIAMGVGGTFDYWAGKVTRAPKIVRSFGFEWLWRLILQPWRAKRQMALPIFAYLVFREKLKTEYLKLKT